MATVRFYGDLKRFGREFRLEVKSTGEAIKALVTQLPGLRQAMQPGWYRVRYGKGKYLYQHDLQRGLSAPLAADEVVHIVPMAAGAKSGWGTFAAVALGAGLIAAAFFTGGTSLAAWGALEFGAAALGAGLLFAGVASLMTLTPASTPKTADAEQDRRNTTFSSIDNLAPQGRQVPVCYGTMMTGSLTISQGIYSV